MSCVYGGQCRGFGDLTECLRNERIIETVHSCWRRLDVPYFAGDMSEKSRKRTNNIQSVGNPYIKKNYIPVS